jgi:hypothetical protein
VFSGGGPEGLGHVADKVVIGEEVFQVRGEFQVPGKQFAAVGCLPPLDRLQIVGQDFLDALFVGGSRPVVRHGALRSG